MYAKVVCEICKPSLDFRSVIEASSVPGDVDAVGGKERPAVEGELELGLGVAVDEGGEAGGHSPVECSPVHSHHIRDQTHFGKFRDPLSGKTTQEWDYTG